MKKEPKPVKYICTVSIHLELDTVISRGTIATISHGWYGSAHPTGKITIEGEFFAGINIPASMFLVCFKKYGHHKILNLLT